MAPMLTYNALVKLELTILLNDEKPPPAQHYFPLSAHPADLDGLEDDRLISKFLEQVAHQPNLDRRLLEGWRGRIRIFELFVTDELDLPVGWVRIGVSDGPGASSERRLTLPIPS
jgi:hypothetical protein